MVSRSTRVFEERCESLEEPGHLSAKFGSVLPVRTCCRGVINRIEIGRPERCGETSREMGPRHDDHHRPYADEQSSLAPPRAPEGTGGAEPPPNPEKDQDSGGSPDHRCRVFHGKAKSSEEIATESPGHRRYAGRQQYALDAVAVEPQGRQDTQADCGAHPAHHYEVGGTDDDGEGCLGVRHDRVTS
jgi:hypothetical protein